MRTETCTVCGKTFFWDNAAFFGGAPERGWFGAKCSDCAKEEKDQLRHKERLAQEERHHQERLDREARALGDLERARVQAVDDVDSRVGGYSGESTQQTTQSSPAAGHPRQLAATLPEEVVEAKLRSAWQFLSAGLYEDAIRTTIIVEEVSGPTSSTFEIKLRAAAETNRSQFLASQLNEISQRVLNAEVASGDETINAEIDRLVRLYETYGSSEKSGIDLREELDDIRNTANCQCSRCSTTFTFKRSQGAEFAYCPNCNHGNPVAKPISCSKCGTSYRFAKVCPKCQVTLR